MSNRERILLVILALLALVTSLAAQAPANLRGQVTDPSGAAIPAATVTVTGPNGLVRTAETNDNGAWNINGLPPGSYVVRVGAVGFDMVESTTELNSGRLSTVNSKLSIAIERQEVTVQDQQSVEVDPGKNASATVLSGSDLDMLSDDPNDLANDLQALAGPAAGPNGGQIFVDGFSNGQLPPKNSIREIRINSNPFAAEFDRIGFGRIEILTKPGTDRLRGSILADFDAGRFDARNPYCRATATNNCTPAFLTRNFQGNIGGSIGKKASYFVDYSNRHQDDQSLINATILNPDFTINKDFSQTVSTPNTRQSFSPRFDYQLGMNHTLQARYSLNKTDNPVNGVGGFNLLSQATRNQGTTHSFNLTETWIVNTTTINESRFQYAHSDNSATGVSNLPTINVTGAFSGNAATNSLFYTTQNSYEFQNYSTMTRGTHLVKFGARIRGTQEDNFSNNNFNGTFSFQTIQSYQAAALGISQGLSLTQIFANGGRANQYSVNTGTPLIQYGQVDVAPFIQDDWRVKPAITLSLGLRYEVQNNISNWANVAPRIGLAWGIGGGTGRTRQPKTVIRAGFGIFYDRFGLNQVAQAQRLNGLNQLRYVVQSPDFLWTSIPAPSTFSSTTPLTTYRIDPGIVAPRVLQYSIGIERQLPKNVTVSLNYNTSRGLHQLRSRNLNAPLGYVFGDPLSGLYPLGNRNPTIQYESSGLLKQSQLTVNVNARLNARYTMFGFYNYGHASNDTDGAGSFPANQYDLTSEWGRSGFDVRHRMFVGGNIAALYGIRLAPFINFSTAAPYNITLGQDLNGDTNFTDRPTFATALANPTFAALYPNAVASNAIIPRNYGQAFGAFSVNMRVSRTWGFGEVTTRAAGGGGGGRGGGGGGGFRGPGGGGGFGPPGGGPGGPGGIFAGGGSNRRYQMTLSVDIRNAFNSVNPGIPVGTLQSPLFGQSQGITGGFGPQGGGASQSANRRLEMQLRFNF